MATRTKIGAPVASPAQKLEEHLPAKVLASVDSALAGRKRLRKEFIAKLDTEFCLSARPGLSGTDIAALLRRRHKALASRREGTSSGAEEPASEGADDAGVLREFRTRQVSIAAILDALFGKFAECDPTLWDRRAYHLIVGLLYERLATGADEVGTDELVKLAKALSEVRRAMSRAPAADASTGDADAEESLEESESSELPPRLARAVRMVYGMAEASQADGKARNGSVAPVGVGRGTDGAST